MFSLGRRLREERERLKLSQDSLGELFGVDRKVIGNYEGNKTSPRVDQLIKMMEAGADALYILTGVRSPVGASESSEPYKPAERAAAAIRGMTLTEEDAEMVRALAERLAREK